MCEAIEQGGWLVVTPPYKVVDSGLPSHLAEISMRACVMRDVGGPLVGGHSHSPHGHGHKCGLIRLDQTSDCLVPDIFVKTGGM